MHLACNENSMQHAQIQTKTLNNKCNVKMHSLGLDIHIRQEFTPAMGALSVFYKIFAVGSSSSTDQSDRDAT